MFKWICCTSRNVLQDGDVIEERAVEDSTTSVPGNLGRAAQVNAVRERIFLLARWDDLPFVCVPSSVILFVCLLFCCPMHSSPFSVCSNVLQDEPPTEDGHATQDVHANLRRAAAADEVCPCIVCVHTVHFLFASTSIHRSGVRVISSHCVPSFFALHFAPMCYRPSLRLRNQIQPTTHPITRYAHASS